MPSLSPHDGHCPSFAARASAVTRTGTWLPCRLVGAGTTSAVSGSTQTMSVDPCAASPGAKIHARAEDGSVTVLPHTVVGFVSYAPPAVTSTPHPERPQCRQNT